MATMQKTILTLTVDITYLILKILQNQLYQGFLAIESYKNQANSAG
jgi:hypothetical protein